MTKLSRNFTLEELCASQTAKAKGIKNQPGTQEIVCLTALTQAVLQPLREWWCKPIVIGSGYRCPALNKAVGGVSNSQHMKGQAVDLFIDGDKAKGQRWFEYIRNHLPFDQLIWEHNSKTGAYWVHVSFVYPDFGKNRHKVIDLLEKK